ncbi:unnamed protein product, partial [Rotaria magnacalcarata]
PSALVQHLQHLFSTFSAPSALCSKFWCLEPALSPLIISHWLRTHRDEMNLKQDALLEENKDYHIEFKNVNNSNESAAVICGCGTKATLSRVNNTGYYQISNYYRHIERGNCSVMQKKLNADQEKDDDESNGDNNTNSNTSSVTPKSPLNGTNQNRISSKKRRLSTSTPATRRRTKRRRL